MPIPTEGLGEKRYRAALAKNQAAGAGKADDIVAMGERAIAAATQDVAVTAEKLGIVLNGPAATTTEMIADALDALKVEDQQVDVDPAFEAEFAALEVAEAEAAKKPIDIVDPFDAAPTQPRTVMIGNQKVIDMGSVRITATPEKIETQIMPPPVERPRVSLPPQLSEKTLAEMAAGRKAVARHTAARPAHAPETFSK